MPSLHHTLHQMRSRSCGRMCCPEVADVHGAGATGAALFDAAFQQALSGLSDHIQGAADRDHDGTKQD